MHETYFEELGPGPEGPDPPGRSPEGLVRFTLLFSWSP